MIKGEDYLVEATRGDYSEKSEDRLTQTFAATFNHSLRFRRVVARILGFDPLRAKDLRALTQQAYRDGGSRLDLKIVRPMGSTVAVIESKIEAPLYSEQLERYSVLPGLGAATKIALVKNYFDLTVPPGWKLLHWSDIHGGVLTASRTWPDDTDSFLARAFLKRLENLRMGKVAVIEEHRLRDFAAAARALTDGSVFSLSSPNVFETAADYIGMLEELVGHIRSDAQLPRLIGKNVRFKSRMGWFNEPGGKYFWIGYWTPLPKARNGYKGIGTGICLYTDTGKYDINSYLNLPGGRFKELFHGYRKLDFDRYAREALSFWKRELN